MSRQGSTRPRTTENVRTFWDKEAEEWGDNPQVTIRDHYFRLLEVATICGLIKGRRSLLDIGCGTGFSTLFYAEQVERATGVDYAPQMVERAKRLLADPSTFKSTMSQFAYDGPPTLRGNVGFDVGNILKLEFPTASFDTVVAERVLINLPTVALQDDAIGEVARVMAPGALACLVEVTQQGHDAVDVIRTTLGLSKIEKYWHNLYIDEHHLAELLPGLGLTLEKVCRFETFQFLTKAVHPLAVAPEEPRFLCGYNDAARRVATQFPSYADVSAIGLESFLKDKFRPLLAQHEPEKLAGFDRVVPQVVTANPDFSHCSHQVLHVLRKAS